MEMLDRKTNQSLVGINSPISEYENFNGPPLAGGVGGNFAHFRNTAYGLGPETQIGPPDTLPDTLAEKSLTMPYDYEYGAPFSTSTSAMAASILDKNGLTPPTYEDNGPADGRY